MTKTIWHKILDNDPIPSLCKYNETSKFINGLKKLSREMKVDSVTNVCLLLLESEALPHLDRLADILYTNPSMIEAIDILTLTPGTKKQKIEEVVEVLCDNKLDFILPKWNLISGLPNHSQWTKKAINYMSEQEVFFKMAFKSKYKKKLEKAIFSIINQYRKLMKLIDMISKTGNKLTKIKSVSDLTSYAIKLIKEKSSLK